MVPVGGRGGEGEMPTRISIGTRKAFQNHYEFKYVFNDAVNGYFCEQTTEFGRDSEVLAIFTLDMPDGPWHVAMEGRIEDESGASKARQIAFRTQASFWEAGSYQWQVCHIATCHGMSILPSIATCQGPSGMSRVKPDWPISKPTPGTSCAGNCADGAECECVHSMYTTGLSITAAWFMQVDIAMLPAVFQSNPITTPLGHRKLFVPTVAKVRPRQLPKGQVGTIMPLERWGTHQWFPWRKQQHTFGPLWGNSFMPNAWCELSSWTPNIYLSRTLNLCDIWSLLKWINQLVTFCSIKTHSDFNNMS